MPELQGNSNFLHGYSTGMKQPPRKYHGIPPAAYRLPYLLRCRRYITAPTIPLWGSQRRFERFLSPPCNFTLPPLFGPCGRFKPHFHKTHVKSRYAIYSCNSLQFHILPGSPLFKCNVSGCIVVLFCKLDGSILQKSQGCISAVDSICNIAHI